MHMVSARQSVFLLLGFVGGVAFVVACPRPSGGGGEGSGSSATSSSSGVSTSTGTGIGPGTASAATGDGVPCDAWEINFERKSHDFTVDESLAVAAGWEPFQ